jgi:hypothetical protein
LFHAWGKQVIAGIGWELVHKAAEEEGRTLPDFQDLSLRHHRHQVAVNPTLFSALIDEAVQKSGCELLLHTLPAAIEKIEQGWRIQLCGKDGLESVETKWIIDATGDANAAALAGAAFKTPDAVRQPGTLVFRLEGYHPQDIDMERLDEVTQKAYEAGQLDWGDFGWCGRPSLRQVVGSKGVNAIHVMGIDAKDSRGKTHAEVKARAAVLRLYRFLKQQPGFDKLSIAWCAPECGIRETRIIDGESTVTRDEYFNGKEWPDAVCYSFYPIDLHTDEGLTYEVLPEGVIPTLPLSAMIPKGMDGLLVAGRSLSSDRLANSALRVQASCMAMGQAAAAAAGLAVRQNLRSVQQVPLEDIKQALRKEHALVPQA